jgi:hypothetical protein
LVLCLYSDSLLLAGVATPVLQVLFDRCTLLLLGCLAAPLNTRVPPSHHTKQFALSADPLTYLLQIFCVLQMPSQMRLVCCSAEGRQP